jgi:hypothetical protein
VAAETTQEAQDVVFGMFLVNSASASVLFDSGASHSFIFSQFVAKHGIPVHSMSSHMLVSLPREIRRPCISASVLVSRLWAENFVQIS